MNQTQIDIDVKTVVNEQAVILLPLAGQLVEQRQLNDVLAGLKRLNQGIFRLVVMGEIKKGKSSFINALLGEPDLLPTSSDVATSVVFKLIYGPKRRSKCSFFLTRTRGSCFRQQRFPRSDKTLRHGRWKSS